MLKTHFFQKSLAFMLLLSFILSACSGRQVSSGPANTGADPILVVAAENFYGDVARQIGGAYVSVTNILSNPNIDPHSFEASVQNALAVTQAQLVIENGDGYDTWMDKLIGASPNPNRILVVAAMVSTNTIVDNPHVWYGIDNIQAIAQAIASALEKIDPVNKTGYQANLTAFEASLVPIQQKMSAIKTKYNGIPVGLTETIFLYQAIPLGLNVLTPYSFEKAIAEGNDPPVDSVVTANDQLTSHAIKVLIYNAQTVSPITTNLQNEATRLGIPIVSITETMPAGKTYQQWMMDQLNALQKALGG